MPREKEKETLISHQGEPVVVQYNWHRCSPDTTHHWECQGNIHALKLCHDYLEGHTTHQWRRSRCRWSRRSRRSRSLGSWLLRLKLGLAPLNSHCVYGTHHWNVCRLKIEDGKMAKNPRDSWKKNYLITSYRIPIDIYKGEYEVRRKVNGKSLKKG